MLAIFSLFVTIACIACSPQDLISHHNFAPLVLPPIDQSGLDFVFLPKVSSETTYSRIPLRQEIEIIKPVTEITDFSIPDLEGPQWANVVYPGGFNYEFPLLSPQDFHKLADFLTYLISLNQFRSPSNSYDLPITNTLNHAKHRTQNALLNMLIGLDSHNKGKETAPQIMHIADNENSEESEFDRLKDKPVIESEEQMHASLDVMGNVLRSLKYYQNQEQAFKLPPKATNHNDWTSFNAAGSLANIRSPSYEKHGQADKNKESNLPSKLPQTSVVPKVAHRYNIKKHSSNPPKIVQNDHKDSNITPNKYQDSSAYGRLRVPTKETLQGDKFQPFIHFTPKTETGRTKANVIDLKNDSVSVIKQAANEFVQDPKHLLDFGRLQQERGNGFQHFSKNKGCNHGLLASHEGQHSLKHIRNDYRRVSESGSQIKDSKDFIDTKSGLEKSLQSAENFHGISKKLPSKNCFKKSVVKSNSEQ